MNDEIKNHLSQYRDFSILFAVESGSRIWGFESLDSDYDVRFVYYSPTLDYLKLFSSRRETFQEFVEVKGSTLDFEGWDVFKFLRLLSKSNPTALEWLRSPIVYIDSHFRKELIELTHSFSRFALFKHYSSLARSNYDKYLKDRIDPSLKQYLYVLRGQLNAIYIHLFNEFPPLDFEEIMNFLSNSPKAKSWDLKMIFDSLKEMLLIKQSGHEYDKFVAPPEVNFWIAETFDQLETVESSIKELDSSDEINKDDLEDILDRILEDI